MYQVANGNASRGRGILGPVVSAMCMKDGVSGDELGFGVLHRTIMQLIRHRLRLSLSDPEEWVRNMEYAGGW